MKRSQCRVWLGANSACRYCPANTGGAGRSMTESICHSGSVFTDAICATIYMAIRPYLYLSLARDAIFGATAHLHFHLRTMGLISSSMPLALRLSTMRATETYAALT